MNISPLKVRTIISGRRPALLAVVLLATAMPVTAQEPVPREAAAETATANTDAATETAAATANIDAATEAAAAAANTDAAAETAAAAANTDTATETAATTANTDAATEAAEITETEALRRAALSRELTAQRNAIAELQSAAGSYDRRLIEANQGLARLLAELGDHEAAASAYNEAMQLSRINHGLYNPQQLPFIDGLIASRTALEQWQTTDDLHALRLHLGSRLYQPDQREYLLMAAAHGRWQLQVLSKNLLRQSGQQRLGQATELSKFYANLLTRAEAAINAAPRTDPLAKVLAATQTDRPAAAQTEPPATAQTDRPAAAQTEPPATAGTEILTATQTGSGSLMAIGTAPTRADLLPLILDQTEADLVLANIVAVTPFTSFQGTGGAFVTRHKCGPAPNGVRQCYSVQVENPHYRRSQYEAKQFRLNQEMQAVNRNIARLQAMRTSQLTATETASLDQQITRLQNRTRDILRTARRERTF